MKHLPVIKLVAAFALGLALMYVLQPASGIEQHRHQVDKLYKSRIDSIGRLLVVQRQITEMYAREGLKERALRMKAEAERDSVVEVRRKEKRRYEAIIFRRYADHEYDSVLAALWPE